MSFVELIAYYAAPTLEGMKPSCLFSCRDSEVGNVEEFVLAYTEQRKKLSGNRILEDLSQSLPCEKNNGTLSAEHGMYSGKTAGRHSSGTADNSLGKDGIT